VFTGIVQTMGRVRAVKAVGRAKRFTITAKLRGLALGESVAVNGACMTVAAKGRGTFYIDVSLESLRRTALGSLRAGSTVNLERSLTLADRLGGHLVQGHVDGVGRVVAIEPEANGWRFTFEAPPGVARYLVEKGSITVDGISLTVAGLRGRRFEVAVIPHTARCTTMGARKPGDPVNLEADVLAKYVEKLLGEGLGARPRGRRKPRR
jgi:riboflavin synthase